MSRLFRAVWADKSLLLVMVPVALALTAVLANRTAAEQVVARSATTSTTSTTTTAAPDGAAEVAAPQTTIAADNSTGFATGGRTVTDASGNLVRLPNDVARLPDAEVQGNVLEGGGTDQAPATTTPGGAPTTGPTATTTPSATTAPTATTTPGATTTTLGSTTTTTTPVEPNPVVPESPMTIMLPVSGVVIAGLAWIVVARRRSRVAA